MLWLDGKPSRYSSFVDSKLKLRELYVESCFPKMAQFDVRQSGIGYDGMNE